MIRSDNLSARSGNCICGVHVRTGSSVHLEVYRTVMLELELVVAQRGYHCTPRRSGCTYVGNAVRIKLHCILVCFSSASAICILTSGASGNVSCSRPLMYAPETLTKARAVSCVDTV